MKMMDDARDETQKLKLKLKENTPRFIISAGLAVPHFSISP
jgi:hypothetical protein